MQASVRWLCCCLLQPMQMYTRATTTSTTYDSLCRVVWGGEELMLVSRPLRKHASRRRRLSVPSPVLISRAAAL